MQLHVPQGCYTSLHHGASVRHAWTSQGQTPPYAQQTLTPPSPFSFLARLRVSVTKMVLCVCNVLLSGVLTWDRCDDIRAVLCVCQCVLYLASENTLSKLLVHCAYLNSRLPTECAVPPTLMTLFQTFVTFFDNNTQLAGGYFSGERYCYSHSLR